MSERLTKIDLGPKIINIGIAIAMAITDSSMNTQKNFFSNYALLL